MSSNDFIIFNALIDLCFLVDIIINFRCTYLSLEGKEIFEPGEIAVNYVKGTFFLDFFAILPIDLITEAIMGE